MDKTPEWFLSFYESLLSAQLRVIRQLKSAKPEKPKTKEERGMSNIDMAMDILRRAQKPLHVSDIIAQVKTRYRVELDRESLVSALVKKVHRQQGISRTDRNPTLISCESS
jgi:hypothetical protein